MSSRGLWARSANRGLSTNFVFNEIEAGPVLWLAVAGTSDGGDNTFDCLSAFQAQRPEVYLDAARSQDEKPKI